MLKKTYHYYLLICKITLSSFLSTCKNFFLTAFQRTNIPALPKSTQVATDSIKKMSLCLQILGAKIGDFTGNEFSCLRHTAPWFYVWDTVNILKTTQLQNERNICVWYYFGYGIRDKVNLNDFPLTYLTADQFLFWTIPTAFCFFFSTPLKLS